MTKSLPASSDNLTKGDSLTNNLTYDEHVTRALLMGGRYRDRVHIYYINDGPEKVRRLDADTLQPLSSREVYERYRAAQETDR